MTAEEVAALVLLRKNHTVADTNHIPIPDGGGPGQVDLSRLISPAGRLMVENPPSVDEPVNGISFTHTGIEGAVAAVVVLPAMGSQATVVQFSVPFRHHGVIDLLANQYIGPGQIDGTGNVIWQLLVDAVPYKNYENITRNSPDSGWNLSDRKLHIYDSQLVQLICKNVAVNPIGQPLVGTLGGYFYSIEAEGGQTWL